MQPYEVVGAEGVQAYETGDPLAEQGAHRVGGQVGVAGVVTRTEQTAEGVHQAGDLELLVGRPCPAQQRGGAQGVLVLIPRTARTAGTTWAAGRVPGAPARVQQIHQLVDAAQLHASVLPSPPARNAVATQEQIMVGLLFGQRDLNCVPKPAIRWSRAGARSSGTRPIGW
ncbi:hypothetical protein [Streptomyces ossamyceticus]|uniref:hypothetical protein n=1 Tax=Streptomyces ossamyceticus TaxID=249581 RepID=UPI0012FEA860|nr:hypothetical protein [Streptomyces ossamyceticus]